MDENLSDAIADVDPKAAEEAITLGAKLHEIKNDVVSLILRSFESEAKRQKRLKLVKILIDAGLNVNIAHTEYTLLFYAAQTDIDLARLLIESGADVLLYDPLRAVTDLQMTYLLIQAGADPNGRPFYSTISRITHSPLVLQLGREPSIARSIVRYLIFYGANVNLTGQFESRVKDLVLESFQYDPILQAIATHETDKAEKLLSHLYHAPIPEEEIVHLKNRMQEIFLVAIAQRENKLVDLILKNFRVYISIEEGFERAARTGNLEAVRALNEISEASTNPISPTVLTETLRLAAIGGHLETVRYLLLNDRLSMRIDLRPALDRIERIVRHDGSSEVYHQIYTLLTVEEMRRPARILRHAAYTGQGIEIPSELRHLIASFTGS